MRAIQRQKGVSRLLDENQRIRFDDAGVEMPRTEPEPPIKADVSRFAKDSGHARSGKFVDDSRRIFWV